MKRLVLLVLCIALIIPVGPSSPQPSVVTTEQEIQFLWRADPTQFEITDAKLFPRVQFSGSGSLSNLGLANLAWTIALEGGLIPAFALYNHGILSSFTTIDAFYQNIEYFPLGENMIIIAVKTNSTDVYIITSEGQLIGRSVVGETSDHQLFVDDTGSFFLYANNTTFKQTYYYVLDGFNIEGSPTSERITTAGIGAAVIEQASGERVFYTSSGNITLPSSVSDNLHIGQAFLQPVLFDLGNQELFLPLVSQSFPFPTTITEFFYFGLQSSIISDGNSLYELSPSFDWEEIAHFSQSPLDFAIVDIGLYLGPQRKSGLGLVMAGSDTDSDDVPDTMEDYFGSYSTQIDSDEDGISDKAEILFGTDPIVKDTMLDYDNDRMANAAEITQNLDPLNPDSDYGGALDGWEIFYEYNASDPLDDDDDDDNDGMINSVESRVNSNPRQVDTDFDGMDDGWEIEHGLDPTFDDANEDPDQDGLSNIEEYALDSDPLVENPRLLFEGLWIEIGFSLIVSFPLGYYSWRKLGKNLDLENYNS